MKKGPCEEDGEGYTWREVRKHNTAKSLWMVVHGRVYDITTWVDKHPGGREQLLLYAGRDATYPFISHHPFTCTANKMLKKFDIGHLRGGVEFVEYASDESGFYATTTARVKDYFEKNGLDPKNPITGIVRMIPVVILFVLTFLITNNGLARWGLVFPMWVRLISAPVFAVCEALPLLHIMHDATHTAFGHNQRWWWWGGRLTSDFMVGGSVVHWVHQHNVGHHTYTNLFLVDPDLPNKREFDIRRVVPAQVWIPIYKYQHIYMLILYGFYLLKNRIQDWTCTFWGRMNGPIHVNPFEWDVWFQYFMTKTFWISWRILMPIFYFSVPVREFVLLFLYTEFIAGWYIIAFFQMSHNSTEAHYPVKGNFNRKTELKLKDEWAVSQVECSVNYATVSSPITTFLAGALNYQIEHHLYPGVSQYYYPSIAPIVKQTCKEFGVRYADLPNWTSAFKAHYNHLKNMGSHHGE